MFYMYEVVKRLIILFIIGRTFINKIIFANIKSNNLEVPRLKNFNSRNNI